MKTIDYVEECLKIISPLLDRYVSRETHHTILAEFLGAPLDSLNACLLTIRADLETKTTPAATEDVE